MGGMGLIFTRVSEASRPSRLVQVYDQQFLDPQLLQTVLLYIPASGFPPAPLYMQTIILQWLRKSCSKSCTVTLLLQMVMKQQPNDCSGYTANLVWLRSSTREPWQLQYFKLVFLKMSLWHCGWFSQTQSHIIDDVKNLIIFRHTHLVCFSIKFYCMFFCQILYVLSLGTSYLKCGSRNMLGVGDVFLQWLVQTCTVRGFVKQWKSIFIKYQTSGLEWLVKKHNKLVYDDTDFYVMSQFCNLYAFIYCVLMYITRSIE